MSRSKWLDWKPKTHILSKSAEMAPTEPTNPGLVGSVGSPGGDFQKIVVHAGLAGRARTEGLSTAREFQSIFGGAARIIPFDTCRRRKLWSQWQVEQQDRMFAEARKRRAAAVPAPTMPPSRSAAFQRLFFEQLALIAFDNRAKFIRDAVAQGIPREAAEAFVKISGLRRSSAKSSSRRTPHRGDRDSSLAPEKN